MSKLTWVPGANCMSKPPLTWAQLLDRLVDSIAYRTGEDDSLPTDPRDIEMFRRLRRELSLLSLDSVSLVMMAVETAYSLDCECGARWEIDRRGIVTNLRWKQ